jgi:hypothetical protein
MFKKNNFVVIKKAISKETAAFLYNYLSLKKKVAAKLFESGFITEFDTHYGIFGDGQCPNAYSHYADIAMETLLLDLVPVMKKYTGVELLPTYSYTRFYTKGDELVKHKDRHECEISTTLNLGGDEWPIFIHKDPKEGQQTDKGYVPSTTKGFKVIFKTRRHVGLQGTYIRTLERKI